MNTRHAVVLAIALVLSSCTTTKPTWAPLFNGEDLSGWTAKVNHHEPGVNYANTFRMEDGIIKVRYDGYGDDYNDQFAHLYYDTPYSHYRLRLEYRFVGEMEPTAPEYVIRNSGIMIHSQDPRNMRKDQNWPISVEMQFLGGLDDGKPRPTGNMCSPGTHIVYEGELDTRHCINSSSDTYFGDQWVRAEILVLGDSLVSHLIEGEVVLEYSKPQMGGTGVVENFDPAEWQDGKLLTSGFIALQSEGQPIDFRNVEFLNLTGCMDPKAKNFGAHYVNRDDDTCVY